MQLALDKGDFAEVVSIYIRIQSIPAVKTSQILKKVLVAANDVIFSLKNQCLDVLLNPSSNYLYLLKFGKILLDIDGLISYSEVIRRCFSKQLCHFINIVNTLRNKFVIEAAEAYKSGQDLNLIRSISNVNGFGESNEAEKIIAMRKHINSTRRNSIRHKINSSSSRKINPIHRASITTQETSDSVSLFEDEEESNFRKSMDEFQIDDDVDEFDELESYLYNDFQHEDPGNEGAINLLIVFQ
jgi:hypothetical protein